MLKSFRNYNYFSPEEIREKTEAQGSLEVMDIFESQPDKPSQDSSILDQLKRNHNQALRLTKDINTPKFAQKYPAITANSDMYKRIKTAAEKFESGEKVASRLESKLVALEAMEEMREHLANLASVLDTINQDIVREYINIEQIEHNYSNHIESSSIEDLVGAIEDSVVVQKYGVIENGEEVYIDPNSHVMRW